MEDEHNPPSLPVKDKRTPKVRRVPRASLTYFRNAGKYYLEKFPASVQQFRRVMMRKAERSARAHPDIALEDCKGWIDTVVAEMIKAGLLNDAAYAMALATSLKKRGLPRGRIIQTLRLKGVAPPEMDDEGDETDPLVQALRWCKRKKLPPFQARDLPPEKAMARLGRAGFDFETARRALETARDEAEEILLKAY